MVKPAVNKKADTAVAHIPMVDKVPGTEVQLKDPNPDIGQYCKDGSFCYVGTVCCLIDGRWSCCYSAVPYGVQEKPDFVSLPKVSDEQIYEYCPDGSTCPPGKKCCMTQCGWTCCIATLSLLQASPERRNASVSIPARPVKPSVSVVTCDKQRSCLSGQTCCKHPRGTFSCCPFPKKKYCTSQSCSFSCIFVILVFYSRENAVVMDTPAVIELLDGPVVPKTAASGAEFSFRHNPNLRSDGLTSDGLSLYKSPALTESCCSWIFLIIYSDLRWLPSIYTHRSSPGLLHSHYVPVASFSQL
ncbi:hypothetical protein MHYP_G00129710 [Metynnis hypsauchen]